MLFDRKKKLVDCSFLLLILGGLDFGIYCKFMVYTRIFLLKGGRDDRC